MSRVALVLNPVGVAEPDPLLEELRTRCENLGHEAPLILETTETDPGTGMARQALTAGVDRVLVAGGDGTVRTVAETLTGSGVPLAILPTGTGNLLARNLDLPLDVADALDVALTGPVRALDVGRLDGRVFIVMAGMGLDAAMMQDAPDALKARIGWPAYLVGGARALRRGRFRVRVSVDGAPALTRRVSTVLVGNVGMVQGGLTVVPEADPDDGCLDVALLAPRSARQWLALLTRLALRRPPGADDPRMERLRGRQVSVRASQRRPRQVDGDPIDPGTTLTVGIEPAALLVVAPTPVQAADSAGSAAAPHAEATTGGAR